MIGVYEIKNKLNNKTYIGSSIQLNRRLWYHKHQLRKGTHHNIHLQRAWNKYGKDAFEFSILVVCEEHDLLLFEQSLMDKLHPEYNIAKFADAPNRGRRYSKEHCDKLSSLRIGRKISEQGRIAISDSKLGEKNPSAKLTKEDVLNIRYLYASGGVTYQQLAILFSISLGHVGAIVTKRKWAHV